MTTLILTGTLLALLGAALLARVLGDAPDDDARQAPERRLDDVSAPTADTRSGLWKSLLFGLASLVCVAAVAAYVWLVTPPGPSGERITATVFIDAGHSVAPEQIEALIGKLVVRLMDNPENAEGWAMLARSYAVLGHHEQAAPAFKQAVALRGDNAALLADYAEALAGANDGQLDGEPSRLVQRALGIDPSNLKALSLAGIHAFQHKDYPLALKHWEKLVQLAPNDEISQQVQGGIDEARQLARDGGTASARVEPAATAVAPASVSITSSTTP